MVSKDQFDHIEQEFRSRFEEPPYDIPQEWNMPSDAIWENVSAEIETKKRKRRYLWFLLLLLPLGLFTGKQLLNAPSDYKSQTENHSDNNFKNNHNDLSKNKIPESSAIENHLTNKGEKTSNTAMNDSENLNKFSAPQSFERYNRDLISQPTLHSTAKYSDISNYQEKTVSYSNQYITKNKATTNQLLPNNSPQTILVDRLDGVTPLITLNEHPIFSLSKRDNKTELEGKAKKKVHYGILGGAFTPNASVSNEYNQLLTPFDFYYENELSYELGGFVSIPISNKIELESGLEYRTQRFKTGHNSDIVYDQSAEDFADNISFSAYDSSFATSFGIVDANMIIARNSNSEINNEEFTVDINMNQRINQISLPIKPKITLWENESAGIKVNPALNLNYIVSQNTSVKNIETNSDKISDHNSKVTGSLSQLNDFTTDQSLAIELVKKQFIGKTDLSIEPYYTINSGNIFEQDSFSSKTRAAGVNLKLRLK